jgi:hypothetical protein
MSIKDMEAIKEQLQRAKKQNHDLESDLRGVLLFD